MTKDVKQLDTLLVDRWFLYQAVRLRFVGATPPQLRDLREDLIIAAERHRNSPALFRFFDEVCERHYPKRFADDWLAAKTPAPQGLPTPANGTRAGTHPLPG